MLRLTLDFLAFNPHQIHTRANIDIFHGLLPQLALARPYVGAAAAAFGAAYDVTLLRRDSVSGRENAVKLYLKALRHMQDEIKRDDIEMLPLVLATILLAATESVQEQQHLAFNHVAPAFCMAGVKDEGLSVSRRHATPPKELGPFIDLFRDIDQCICLWTWGRIPGFAPVDLTPSIRNPSTIDDLIGAQAALQQHCLHFFGNIVHSTSCNRKNCIRHELMDHQQDLIEMLRHWLDVYDILMNNILESIPPAKLRQAQNAKASMLVTYISTSNIKPTMQRSYDAYSDQFDEIIRLAESILGAEGSTTGTSTTSSASSSPGSSPRERHTSNLVPYTASYGMIYPLAYTARKYRAPRARRRAIELLGYCGIEGPFHAWLEARIAAHIIALEEAGPHQPIPVFTPRGDINETLRVLNYHNDEVMPPEENRICVAWIMMETDDEDSHARKSMDEIAWTGARIKGRTLRICRKRCDMSVLVDNDNNHPSTSMGHVGRMIDGDGTGALEEVLDWSGLIVNSDVAVVESIEI